jgi:hypothetical protein
MKKLVAISVLLAILTAAVFAQDDGPKWNVGFTASLGRNIFFATKATGEGKTSVSGTTPSTPDQTYKLGDYIKGSTAFWTYTNDRKGGDNRLIVSISNSGPYHKAYIDFKLDNKEWINKDGPTFMDLLSGGAADWEFSGSTAELGGPLVIDGKVGTGRYGGFVPVNEFWNDYLDWAGHNFFGVYKADGFQPSNNISVTGIDGNPWASVYALGLTFGDIRFAVGSTLGSFYNGPNNPLASASGIEAGFMLSGRNLGPLTFDVFYAINGSDENTVLRDTGGWKNLLGAYFGLNIVENLGLSIGYTANFTAIEKGEDPDGTSTKAFEYVTPIYSGVDIKINYSGIDKMGITFNNNVSFAGAEGAEVKNPGDKRVVGIKRAGLGKDQKEGWFAWDSILALSYSVTDNVNITLALGNNMGTYTYEGKSEQLSGTTVTSTTTTNNSTTTNEFRASVIAGYSVGSVSFGIGLNLGIAGYSINNETKVSPTGGTTVTTTTTALVNTTTFGIPLFFKVAL